MRTLKRAAAATKRAAALRLLRLVCICTAVYLLLRMPIFNPHQSSIQLDTVSISDEIGQGIHLAVNGNGKATRSDWRRQCIVPHPFSQFSHFYSLTPSFYHAQMILACGSTLGNQEQQKPAPAAAAATNNLPSERPALRRRRNPSGLQTLF
jgi:hypothetical protein